MVSRVLSVVHQAHAIIFAPTSILLKCRQSGIVFRNKNVIIGLTFNFTPLHKTFFCDRSYRNTLLHWTFSNPGMKQWGCLNEQNGSNNILTIMWILNCKPIHISWKQYLICRNVHVMLILIVYLGLSYTKNINLYL